MNPTETVKTRLSIKVVTWKGEKRLDVRHIWEDEDGDWHPTKKGITVPFDQDAAPLISALAELYRAKSGENVTF